MARFPQHNQKRGFTLLEMTVAVGVLGVGLIMVAAFFPAALLEHQRTVDDARALNLSSKAETMLHNRLNPDLLYVDQFALAAGFDSPWYAIPFVNMRVRPDNTITNNRREWDPTNVNGALGNCLDPDVTQVFYNLLNNVPIPATNPCAQPNPVQLFGLDYLSDRVLPRNAARVQEDADRLAWYGFYRTLASGKRDFAAVVCKPRKDRQYAVQDLSDTPENNYGTPRVRIETPTVNRFFPVPWRVTVGRIAGTNVLANQNNATVPGGVNIDALAPRGSKIMLHGRARTFSGGGVLDFPLGRILTVVEASPPGPGDNRSRIRILEDISDIPEFDPSGDGFRFDIWVFPPAVNLRTTASGSPAVVPVFEDESPVLRWKVGL